MTLGEAELIFESWREAPPAHHLLHVLARLWGWKSPALGSPRDESRGAGAPASRDAPDAREVLAIPGMQYKPVGEGLPAVMLDFEALKVQARRNRAGS